MTIRSKPNTPEYERNFDLIFGPKRKPKPKPDTSADGWSESYESHPQAD